VIQASQRANLDRPGGTALTWNFEKANKPQHIFCHVSAVSRTLQLPSPGPETPVQRVAHHQSHPEGFAIMPLTCTLAFRLHIL
jgi:hypothetical protein